MTRKYTRIRGTRDILPSESRKWRYVEGIALEVAERYGFGELRTPVIEKTELFIKSTGETTDIVQKEMYSFDKGHEHITLRPEGTPGAVRAALENSLLSDALPLKLCYIGPNFRHENPQAGRYRQFSQFGLECFGSASPAADAEIICASRDLFACLEIKDVALHINSIGCPQCRPAYHKTLVDYYTARSGEICPTCNERLNRNPLRLLDCKNPSCGVIAKDAPKTLERLCPDCSAHFEGVKAGLDTLGIRYTVDPFIVRGLDYYTKTVFEFISDKIGAQGSVGGGGRYDLLVENMGGPPTAGIGFAMGMDRILMVMEQAGIAFPAEKRCDIYIGSIGAEENRKALELACGLRRTGFYAAFDTVGRSVKAQMKYADKKGAAYSCVIGSDELESGIAGVKNMATGEKHDVALSAEAFAAFLK